MTGDSSGGGQDSVGLVAPKYDRLPPDQEMLVPPGHGQPPPLHEAVIEALAGPSGMQAVSPSTFDLYYNRYPYMEI